MRLSRFLATGTILFGLFSAPFAPVRANDLATQLPDIGTVGASTLSPREENQLGREFMRSVRHSLNILDDLPTTAYLQHLAERLQSQASGDNQPITIFAVNDNAINAFAGPGGYIGIHTGLILAARTEGELASVLAHEIAHVTQRHLVRAFEASGQQNLPTLGALIAAILLGGSNPRASEAILTSALANSAQQQLTYSRSNEQEADRIGLDLLAHNGFDPRQMADFFSILQQRQGSSSANLPEFFRTHPLTLSRVADTRNRAQQYPLFPASDDTPFQLIQARIAMLANTTDLPDSLSKAINSTRVTPTADKYYRALYTARVGAYPQARKLIQALIQATPHRVLYRYSAAQIELADAHPAQARKILEQALALFPGNPPLLELYANTLLQLKQPRIVFDMLKNILRRRPNQYRLYLPYAKAATALGNKTEAYRALAEFHYTLDNKLQAITYLEQALQSPTINRYDRLALEARQKRLKTEAQTEKEAREEEQASQE